MIGTDRGPTYTLYRPFAVCSSPTPRLQQFCGTGRRGALAFSLSDDKRVAPASDFPSLVAARWLSQLRPPNVPGFITGSQHIHMYVVPYDRDVAFSK